MIRVVYKEKIIKSLAAIFSYGFDKQYSFKTIEEHIINSSLVNNLENNEFNLDAPLEFFVGDAFHVNLIDKVDISFRSLFIAESYVKLFFDINRSFEYLFLYWPLNDFVNKYGIYHEMSYSNLLSDFKKAANQVTLFKKLCENKNIKITEINRLTGILLPTLKKYSQSDDNLYGANSQTIYKLATLLNVKSNIFIFNLAIYLDDSIYRFDKNNQTYRNYLGLYFAIYYIKDIQESDYVYSDKEDAFISKDGNTRLKVLFLNINMITTELINKIDNKTYLIIFPSGYSYQDIESYLYLKDTSPKEIMIVTQEETYLIKRNITHEINPTVNRSLIIRAKEKSN